MKILMSNTFAVRALLAGVTAVMCETAAAYSMTEPACGPWLENASETTMSVGWSTRANCAAGIDYRVKGTDAWTRQWQTRSGKLDYSRELHLFHLRNLRPATVYEYRILSAMDRSDSAYNQAYVGSQIRSFKTFDPGRETYSVFLLSDLHGLYEWVDKYAKRFKVASCDFAVMLGDQVNDCVNQPRFAIEDGYLSTVTRLWGKEKPTVFVRGNHDCWGRHAAAAWADYHGRWDDVPYYAFSHGPVLYVVLDDPYDYSNRMYRLSNAAAEVREDFLNAQFAWFKELHASEKWKRATFRVILSHYGVRLGVGDLSGQLRSRYKPLLNGPLGIHLSLSGDDHFAASCLPGEKTYFHNPRNDTKPSGKSAFPPFDGSFDFTEVSGDKRGCLVLEVAKKLLTIRTGDNQKDAPDLDRIEILPDKTAKRISCGE